MSSLDFDLDSHMNHLESEWRQAYESGIAARADYHSVASSPKASADLLEAARARLDLAESLKLQIMAKIGRLEERLIGHGSAD